jgi:magnesium-protoporphyrin IX monomethyl ester (oxidative) cyclase
MAAEMALVKTISKFGSGTPKFGNPRSGSYSKFTTIKMTATSTAKPRKKAGKNVIKETLLAPRFYTTDFDEMETLFNTEINKNLNQAEFEALLQEFKTDFNQTHFVRNKEFKEAADKMQEPLRQIFVEFLERSCTAEFSGFLLYKELGRRLKVWLSISSISDAVVLWILYIGFSLNISNLLYKLVQDNQHPELLSY